MAFFNVIFTAQPPFALGLFDFPKESYEVLYPKNQKSTWLNQWTFWREIIIACVAGSMLFWFCTLMPGDFFANNTSLDGDTFGMMCVTIIIIHVCLKMCLYAESFSPVHIFMVVCAITSWWIYLYIEFPGEEKYMFSYLHFWTAFFAFPFLALLPSFASFF